MANEINLSNIKNNHFYSPQNIFTTQQRIDFYGNNVYSPHKGEYLKSKNMKTNSEIKLEAKAAMTNRWGQAVLFMFIYSLLSAGISTLNLVSPAIASIFMGFPLSLGIAIAFLNFSRTGELPLEKIFSAFNSTYYLKSIGVTLLSTMYTFLWCLLFIIPGIIKGLSYAMAPFIIAEDPSLSGEEAICRSMEMMEGHKMALFLIVL